MNSHRLCSLTNLFLLFMSILNVNINGETKIFMVTDFGAAADAITDIKQAFANAWKSACRTLGVVVSVPAGKTFFLSGGDFVGPCNGRTIFRIDGTLVASNDPKLDNLDYWITFDGISRLTIAGNGVFDGNGASAWSLCGKSPNCSTRPTIESIFLKSEVEEYPHKGPIDGPNTDGIHIGSSSYVEVLDSSIETGDDCVSLGDGSMNMNIYGVSCEPGHSISIGSLGRNKNEEDVRAITVTNCDLSNTENGLRIKTWAPSQSSNIVSDVTYDDIRLVNVKNTILIDQYYCLSGDCKKKGGVECANKGGEVYKCAREVGDGGGSESTMQ
ncbi:hypothetical protein OROHE_018159 [Orobanche hederae]